MTNSKTVPFVVKLHCLAEGVLLNWGNASVVIFCVSVSLLNKLLPHNVTLPDSLLFHLQDFGLVFLCRFKN